MKKRVFSGVQPTGNLHLGNYLGAIRNWVKMQDEYDCIFCIVDLHAITVPQDPKALRNATREVAAAYMACGIDPKKSIIFPQSAVSAHAELAWILNCHTPLGWLERMTQFKEKARIDKLTNSDRKLIKDDFKLLKKQRDIIIEIGKNSFHREKQLIDILNELSSNPSVLEHEVTKKVIANFKDSFSKYEHSKDVFEHFFANLDAVELFIEKISKEDEANFARANLGLFAYPVLMAADILAYKGEVVPVGEDQKQHLELARDIAGAFNRHYFGDGLHGYFPQPEPLIMGEATRVMSLRDGTRKMSKSEESDMSRINLTDDAETIANKIKKAKSDMLEGVTYDPATRPEASNLLNIYASLANISRKDAEEKFRSSNFSTFKKELADVAVAALSPITAKMRVLMDDPESIDGFLQTGTEKAQDIASKNLAEIKDIVGFLPIRENPFR